MSGLSANWARAARQSGRGRARGTLVALGAALLWGGAIVAPVGAADDIPVPAGVFRSVASAQVASVGADREALLPVPDLFRFIALDTTSTYETDLQTARASLLFPGNGLILGPNLACGTFGAQFPEEFSPIFDTCTRYDYPLSVRADASESDRSTAGSLALGAPTDAVSGDAVAARAHAAGDGTNALAALQDLRVLGLPGFGPIPLPLEDLQLDTSVLTVDSALSRTDQAVVKGVLTVRAESVINGVRMVGGLIRIGSIHSVSVVTDDAAGKRVAHAEFQLSGVTVAGQPAAITDRGLVIGDPPSGSGPIQQQIQAGLNQLLRNLGVRVTLLDATQRNDDRGQAVASVGGLLVEIAADVDRVPTIPGPTGDLEANGRYVGSIQLGNTSASGSALTFADDTFDVGGVGSIDTGDGDLPFGGDGAGLAFDGGGSTFDAGSFSATAPGDLGAPSAATAPGRAPTARPGAHPTTSPPLRRIADTFDGRVSMAYLAFALAVLFLCLLPGLFLPARLPRGRR